MTLPSGCPALNDLEWWVLEVGAEVLKPVMLVMMTLEGQNYYWLPSHPHGGEHS